MAYYEGIVIGMGVVLGLWLLMMGLTAWVSGKYEQEEDERNHDRAGPDGYPLLGGDGE